MVMATYPTFREGKGRGRKIKYAVVQFSYNDKQSKTHCILAYLSSPQTCAAGTSGTSGQTGPLMHKRMKKQCSSCIPEILNCSAGHILDQQHMFHVNGLVISLRLRKYDDPPENSDVHGQDERGLRADGTVGRAQQGAAK